MLALLLALTATTTRTPPAHPALWGVSGHHVVARLAATRFSPATRKEVDRLLAGQSLTDASTWPDSIRRSRPETGPFHYVDVPITAAAYDSARDCPDGACVVAALPRFTAILADRSRSDLDRGEALRWVIHLVGDIHQPLHVGDNHDKGGNDVRVTLGGRSMNLHSAWDTRIMEVTGFSEDQWVERLTPLMGHPSPDIMVWVRESHTLSRDLVYALLTADRNLDLRYAQAALPAIDRQLANAGARLAVLLNQSLDHP